MRPRLLASVGVLIVFSAWFLLRNDRETASARPAPLALPEQPVSGGSALGPAPPLSRDPFQYGDERPAGPEPSAPAVGVPVASPQPTPALEPPVRLGGFLRRGSDLRAVISIRGEVFVLSPRESAEGYQLLSVDEESGARLRGPDGVEIVLRPAGQE